MGRIERKSSWWAMDEVWVTSSDASPAPRSSCTFVEPNGPTALRFSLAPLFSSEEFAQEFLNPSAQQVEENRATPVSHNLEEKPQEKHGVRVAQPQRA